MNGHSPWFGGILSWLGLYLFFYCLPTGVLFQGYQVYHQNIYDDQLIQQVEFHTTELNSKRNHVSNDRVVRQIAQDFRESFFSRGSKQGPSEHLFRLTQEDLPADTIFFAWNGYGALYFPASYPQKLLSELELLTRILLDGHQMFTETGGLQTEENLFSFKTEKAAQMHQLRELLGEGFPLARAVVSNGELIKTEDIKTPLLFHWDFFRKADPMQGGYAFIIPRMSLSETFGISYMIPRDPGNDSFTTGYFLFGEAGKAHHSYSNLNPVVHHLLNTYQFSPESPLSQNEWTLVVMPLADGSQANLFSIFSISNLNQEMSGKLRMGSILTGIILLIGFLVFYQLYQRTCREGLSIRIKIGGLFLLSLYLPLSLLTLLGLQFSLSQAKILQEAAKDRLKRELRQLETRAVENYRVRAGALRTFKKMDALRELDLEKLGPIFLGMKKQLSRVYLVNSDGEVIFDLDHLFGELGRKPFISNLGRQVVKSAGVGQTREISLDLTSQELFSQGFLKRLAKNQGTLHQIVWPGTGKKVYLFAEMIETNKGPHALIVILEKLDIDRDFLAREVKQQAQRDPELHLFAVNRLERSDTQPALPAEFKANLLPMLSMAQVKEDAETQKSSDGMKPVLVALTAGKILDDFFLGAYLDWSKIMESINRLYFFTVVVLFISLLGTLVLVLVLSRSFLQPISILAKGTQAITSGDLTHALPVTSNDELGELSQAFNHMTKRLRNRLHELTVLYNLTQTASTSHNQREVFELAATYLRDHLGATEAGMGWTNEGEGLENLYLAEPRDSGESEIIRAVLVKSIQTRTFQEEELDPSRNVFAVPLYFEEKDFGGLYLLFPGADLSSDGRSTRFSTDEMSFIETLRHHLSLIIEKQHLFEQAITDGLTRLFVRRFFMANLEKELARAKRYRTELALILIDIDHFKLFNDKYGHQVGDMVLRETSQRIIENIRAVDTPGRYGGEELAIVLPQTDIDDATFVAERIRKAIGESIYDSNGTSLTVTISLGVTALSDRRLNIEEFIEEVDRALYKAKDNGRNRTEKAANFQD